MVNIQIYTYFLPIVNYDQSIILSFKTHYHSKLSRIIVIDDIMNIDRQSDAVKEVSDEACDPPSANPTTDPTYQYYAWYFKYYKL